MKITIGYEKKNILHPLIKNYDYIALYRAHLCNMMDKEMYDAVCSECGNKCKVPFKPTEGRPVKCGDCFKKFRRPERRFDNNNNRRDFNKRKDFDVTCAKCGKKTTVPFKPTQGKPVLCRDCFRK